MTFRNDLDAAHARIDSLEPDDRDWEWKWMVRFLGW